MSSFAHPTVVITIQKCPAIAQIITKEIDNDYTKTLGNVNRNSMAQEGSTILDENYFLTFRIKELQTEEDSQILSKWWIK